MSSAFVCGGECALAGSTASGSALHHWNAIVGTGVTSDTSVKRTGSRSIKLAPAAASTYVKHDHGGTEQAVRFYWNFDVLPTADAIVALFGVATGTILALWFRQASGKLCLAVGNGGGSATAPGDFGPVLVADTWYRVDLSIKVDANPNVMKGQVDGGTEVVFNVSQASTTRNTTLFGTDTGHTYTANLDDVFLTDDVASYPIGAGEVLRFAPTATGTHSLSAGDFKDEGGANITNGDGSWAKIDEVPASDTDYVAEITTGTTDYVEYVYGTASETRVPRAVEQLVAFQHASGNTATHKAQLYDGTSAADAYPTTGWANISTNWLSKQWAAPPSGGSWTTGKFQALRIRWGFSGDANPDIWLVATMIEAEFAPAAAATVKKGAMMGFFGG